MNELRPLRLPDTWKEAQLPLQAWIQQVSQAVNAITGVTVFTVRYTPGVSPNPFPIETKARPSGLWVVRVVDVQSPQTYVDVTGFGWTFKASAAITTIDGLTVGRAYDVTLAVV